MIHSCSNGCRSGTTNFRSLPKRILSPTESKRRCAEVLQVQVLQNRKISHNKLPLKPWLLHQHRQQRNFFFNSNNTSSSINSSSKNGTNRKRRRNPSKKQSKADKKIAHIKKSMQNKRQIQRKQKQTDALSTAIGRAKDRSKPVLQPLSEVVFSSKFQTQVYDRLVSFQNDVQGFLLPKSLQVRVGSQRRPFEERKRKTLVMDGRWWRWNILISLMPAFLLGCYLQYQKPKMIEFFEKQRKMGEKKGRGGGGGGGGGVIHAQDEDNLIDVLASENVDGKSFMDRIGESAKAIFGITPVPVSTLPAQINNDDNAEANDNDSDSEHTTPKHEGVFQARRQNVSGDDDEKMTIKELLARIKLLEEKLNVAPQTSAAATLSQTAELEEKEENRSKVHHNGSNDGRKSNIRKRREEDRNRKMMKQMREEREAQTPPTQTTSLSTTSFIQQFAEAKINEVKNNISKVFGGDSDSQDHDKKRINNDHDDSSNTKVSQSILKRPGQSSMQENQSHENSNETEEKQVSIRNDQLKGDEAIFGNGIPGDKNLEQGDGNIRNHSEIKEENQNRNEKRSRSLNTLWKWTKKKFSKGDE